MKNVRIFSQQILLLKMYLTKTYLSLSIEALLLPKFMAVFLVVSEKKLKAKTQKMS